MLRLKIKSVCTVGLVAILFATSFAPVFASQGENAKVDPFDVLRTKKNCLMLSVETKIGLYVSAWKQGVDDSQMAKCFVTLTINQQASAFTRFISEGGTGRGFEANKAKIIAQKKIASLTELREFVDNQNPDATFGAGKVLAKPWGSREASFAPTMIPVQILGSSTQVNWFADNYWENSMCDGDPSDVDWEYAYWFGEPTYAYQFRVWASTSSVMALLAYYQNVIARAPGDGNVILCLGNASGAFPAWFVAAYTNMYR